MAVEGAVEFALSGPITRAYVPLALSSRRSLIDTSSGKRRAGARVKLGA
jgi:hypothetical protein